MKKILHNLYPEYDESWKYFFGNNTASWYCLFISRYEIFNKYFEWLFPLLFEAEKYIDLSNYNTYQKRALAFLAERLLNIYVYHNKLNICYEPIYYIKKNIYKLTLKIIIKKAIKYILPYGIIKYWKKKKMQSKSF